jgi:maltooligosyltrehalose trehalohydrolase
MTGERLTTLVSDEQLRLAAAAIILSPFIPMLFMGEEYGETNPFQYFTSHSDADLIEAVRKGRREEFDDFTWAGEPPDPHDEATFRRSKLNWSLLDHEKHRSMREFYKHLLTLRRETPALRSLDLRSVKVHADDARKLLFVERGSGAERKVIAFNFSGEPQTLDAPFEGGGRVTLQPYGFELL